MLRKFGVQSYRLYDYPAVKNQTGPIQVVYGIPELNPKLPRSFEWEEGQNLAELAQAIDTLYKSITGEYAGSLDPRMRNFVYLPSGGKKVICISQSRLVSLLIGEDPIYVPEGHVLSVMRGQNPSQKRWSALVEEYLTSDEARRRAKAYMRQAFGPPEWAHAKDAPTARHVAEEHLSAATTNGHLVLISRAFATYYKRVYRMPSGTCIYQGESTHQEGPWKQTYPAASRLAGGSSAA